MKKKKEPGIPHAGCQNLSVPGTMLWICYGGYRVRLGKDDKKRASRVLKKESPGKGRRGNLPATY